MLSFLKLKKTFQTLIVAVFVISNANAQLGFCGGNSGDSIFTEDFGAAPSAASQHISLPAPGITTYGFLGSPPGVFADGLYTVSNMNYQQWNWFNEEDHTIGDTNGRMLVVNASFTQGEFYRTPISGLCENTTYEFSAWVKNLTPRDDLNNGSLPNPCNVRFEIWDSTNTILLKSGNTGDFFGSLLGQLGEWLDYGLVFQTQPGQSSVILKMVNFGVGGYGNDLAIDDIIFESCGDSIAISDGTGNNISLCSSQAPYTTTLSAIPDNSVFSTHFYQWQESTDGVTWTDITGATNQTLTVTGVTSTMYYRAKVAESAINLNNALCNTLSDVFQIDITQAPTQPSIECWETVIFNNTTCVWDLTGTQPTAPTGLECWETATFNNTTCAWEVSGTRPPTPTDIRCWEATFNESTCLWDITPTEPIQPNIECWETAVYNFFYCVWEVSGTQPTEPIKVNCWDDFQFSDTTCTWENIGTEDSIPIIESVNSDGNSIIIATLNTGDFEYSSDGVFYQNSNILSPLEGGQYTVYVRARNGCVGDSVGHLHFVIPSFFTPNGDNRNDTFDLKGIENYASNEVFIFDRYGKLLKSSKNVPFKWNGIFNGQQLPSSDYWYIIIIDNQRFTGHFTLKQ